MNQAPPGVETPLQMSVDLITKVLQRKLFAQSKDEVSLVLFGTPETTNDLADGDNYQNVSVASPLGLVDWGLMEYVQNDIQPSNISADFLDAIVVAMDHLVRGTQGKKGFASKQLVLLSNLSGEYGDDQLEDIINSMNGADIKITVIGPDLDDSDDDSDDERPGPSSRPSQRKPKSQQQKAGEELVRRMVTEVDGDNFSFEQALPMLSHFLSRQVRSTAWKCQMCIGNNLSIPICLYNRIKEAKASTFKKVYAKDSDTALENVRTFHLNDEEETEIEKSDVVDGHRYGSTLVPFSEDDKDAMKYQTEKCFNILCFAPSANIPQECKLGDGTMVCVAEKGDDAATVALSAFINAMYEVGTVAVVRRVYRANTRVVLGVLVPYIKTNHECLIYNEIPFSEDLRAFTFGSLPLSEENTAANQKLAPSDAQLDLMDNLIDNMDLNILDEDEDKPVEAMKAKLTVNPHLQRLFQCLQHRALNPDEPLPPLSDLIADGLKPPAVVEVKCGAVLDKMKAQYKLEKVTKDKDLQTGSAVFKAPDQTDGPPTKRAKTEPEDIQGGMADLVKSKVTEVGTVSPVEDFNDLLSRKDEDLFESACNMMEKRITQLVMDSFGSQSYGKALDCLKALRAAGIQNSEPKIFNDYLCTMKNLLSQKGRADFWQEIVDECMSLISKLECEDSCIGHAEAQQFLAEAREVKEASLPQTEHEDMDDLLDEF